MLRSLRNASLVRDVFQTIFTRVGIKIAGFVAGVYISREIGASERGIFAVASTFLAFGIQFGNLGFHSANTYWVARDIRLLPKVISNSALISILGSLAYFIFYLLFFYNAKFIELSFGNLSLLLIAVPAGLYLLLTQNILIGINTVKKYNLSEVIQQLVYIIFAVILIQFNKSSFYLILSILVSYCGSLFYIRSSFQEVRTEKIDIPLLKEMALYSSKIYFSCLFMYLLLKSDIWMVNHFLGESATGTYAVASSVGDLMILFPSVLGQLILPRLAKSTEGRFRLIMLAIVSICLLCLPLVFIFSYFSKDLILLTYGVEFIGAAECLGLVSAGAFMLGLNIITMNYFASSNMPMVSVLGPALAAILNIILNFQLIPAYGLWGAALSTAIAYGALFILNIVYVVFDSLVLTNTCTLNK